MELISTLSNHLFWDVEKSTIDPELHAKYIIKNVLQYGLYDDWKKIRRFYGLNRIVQEAATMKDLDRKTVAFLSLIANIPKDTFLCYTTIPSTPKHWNF